MKHIDTPSNHFGHARVVTGIGIKQSARTWIFGSPKDVPGPAATRLCVVGDLMRRGGRGPASTQQEDPGSNVALVGGRNECFQDLAMPTSRWAKQSL